MNLLQIFTLKLKISYIEGVPFKYEYLIQKTFYPILSMSPFMVCSVDNYNQFSMQFHASEQHHYVVSVMTVVSTFMKADWFLLLFKSRMDIQFLQFVTVNSSAMADQKLHVMSNNSLWWLDLVAPS